MAKVISIEISNSLIRMVEMDREVGKKKKNIKVYRQTAVPTPPGVIKDGYLQGSAALRDVIKHTLNEKQMKTKDVIFTVASSKIVTREVVLPPVKPGQIDALIRSNLNEYFPIDLSSYDIAHIVLEQFAEGPDKGKYRTMIMAADKNLVSSYDELATMCGLRLVSLDYAGNSIFQSIRREETANRVMVLKIEEGQTTVSVIKNKNLMLQRSINYGINEAVQEVMNQPVFNASSEDEAWELMKKKACIKFNVSETAQRNSYNPNLAVDPELRDLDESPEVRDAKIAVTKSLDTFIGSVRRVIEFYASRNAGDEVDRIMITGSAGAMKGIAKLLAYELGIKTNVVNRLEGVSYYVTSEDAGIYNFVSCIGASFAPVGFISKEKKAKQKKEMDYTPIIVLTVLLILIVCAVMLVTSHTKVQEAELREQDLLALEEQYKKAEQTYIKYTNLQTFRDQVVAGNAMTKRSNDYILSFLEELEQKLPYDVVVSNFRSDDKTVVMSMQVSSKEVAAGVFDMLREMDSIKEVSVPSLSEGGVDEELDEEGRMPRQPQNQVNAEGEEVTPVGGKITFVVTATYNPVSTREEQTEVAEPAESTESTDAEATEAE